MGAFTSGTASGTGVKAGSSGSWGSLMRCPLQVRGWHDSITANTDINDMIFVKIKLILYAFSGKVPGYGDRLARGCKLDWKEAQEWQPSVKHGGICYKCLSRRRCEKPSAKSPTPSAKSYSN